VTGTITLSANASDNAGVSKVDFLVDGTVWTTLTSTPYALSWSSRVVANGSHILTARATDTSGNAATSAPVTITTNNDFTPPPVVLTNPTAGATLSGPVTLTVNASDASGVTQVYYWLDGSYAAYSSTAPFSASWDARNTTNGTHQMSAMAYDGSG